MKYVRVYTGDDGLSYFEDVEVSPEEFLTSTGVTIHEWKSMPTAGYFRLNHVAQDSDDVASPEAGEWGPWHPEPRAEFVIRLVGDVEIQCSGSGEIRKFGPGSVVLVEDVTGKGHRNRRLNHVESIFIPLAAD